MNAAWMHPHTNLRKYTEEETRAMTGIMKNVADRMHFLDEPDAWFDKQAGAVVKKQPHADAIPLIIGEVYQYECFAAFAHDMLYVGNGCVVHAKFQDFFRIANVMLTHLDDLKPWLKQRLTWCRTYTTKLRRQDIVARALMSIGSYAASPLVLNCQLVTHRILGSTWRDAEVLGETVNLRWFTVVIYVLIAVLCILSVANVFYAASS